MHAGGRPRERPDRYVHTGHVVDRWPAQQRLDEPTLAAAQVDDPLGAHGHQHVDHGVQPLPVEADGLLDRLLLPVVLLVRGAGLVHVVLGQPGEHALRERPPVLEVAVRDQVASRVGCEPRPALVEQLAALVVAHPVVLVVIEHGQQHVEVRKQVGQPHGPAEPHRQVAAVAPLGEPVVERDRRRGHAVPEGLEQRTQHRTTATGRQCGHLDLEGQRRGGQVRVPVAPARHGRAEHLAQRDAEQRRGRVRAVVHVPREREALPAPAVAPALAPHQAHGVDLDQQCGGAPVGPGLGEEDVGVAERERHRAHVVGVLVEQETQVGGRRVGGGDGQQHRACPRSEQPS